MELAIEGIILMTKTTMNTTTSASVNLASVVFESEQAAKAAAKAQRAAQLAQTKADEAREKADEERARAYKAFLDVVVKEAPERRSAALTAAGDARAALESAVRGDGDAGVFHAYLRWITARIAVWETDAELGAIRDIHGVPVRSVDPPVFSFAHDIGGIVDHIGLELQEQAAQRIVSRRTDYVNGATS
jgi:multidrug efflux pump subunit AcrA (membrane-fusion protein)